MVLASSPTWPANSTCLRSASLRYLARRSPNDGNLSVCTVLVLPSSGCSSSCVLSAEAENLTYRVHHNTPPAAPHPSSEYIAPVSDSTSALQAVKEGCRQKEESVLRLWSRGVLPSGRDAASRDARTAGVICAAGCYRVSTQCAARTPDSGRQLGD